MEPSNKFTLSTPVAIVIAGIVIAGAVFFGLHSQGGGAVPAQQGKPAKSADISKVNIANEPFIGKADAPVTIAYWFDYQCPFCKQNELQNMSQLMKDYIDTGKVKVVFKDFAFLGEDSQNAAIAARAVWEVAPEQFGAWHTAMFNAQDGENTGWGSKADILALTKQVLGAANEANVEALMTSKAVDYQKAIDADKKEGTDFGITGTPGFIIGKQLVVGLESYDQFKSQVDQAAKGK